MCIVANQHNLNMKKFLLLLTVPVLMMSRLAAQVVDTTDMNQNDVPTVILFDSDFEESSTSVNDASTLLNSSRDVFNSIAAYNFGSLRYRIRGNDSKYNDVMINGITMNDAETGRPVFSNWGGLNDAFRNSVLVEGLGKTYAGFGDLPPSRHGFHRHRRVGKRLVHYGECQLALCGNP